MDRRKKLTDEQVAEIRALFAAGDTGEAIARQYGISPTHAFNIKNNQKRCVKSGFANVSRAFAWLLKGYSVKRECWEDDEYLRYDNQSHMFVMTSGDDTWQFDVFEIGGMDLSVHDWKRVNNEG